jgi:hypothetical protein
MKVKPCFVLGNLIGSEVPLMSHGPNRWKYLNIFWNFTALDKLPMIALNVTIDFFHNSD